MSKFKAGDRVACYGTSVDGDHKVFFSTSKFHGTVTHIYSEHCRVLFEKTNTETAFHEKQLRRLKPKKKKVKKEVRGWVNVYKDSNKDHYIGDRFSKTNKDADDLASGCKSKRLACVEVVGHYEVEE